MSWREITFPLELSLGSRAGIGAKTEIADADAGRTVRAARWTSGRTRMMYEVARSIQTDEQAAELRSFWRCAEGGAHAWRFRDVLDWSTHPSRNATPDDTVEAHRQLIGEGDGSETKFQLTVKYTSGTTTVTRDIARPIKPGQPGHYMEVRVDGVLQTEFTDYSVDYDSGTVRFNTAPPLNEDVHATFAYDTPAHFARATDEQLEFVLEEHGLTSASDVVSVVDDRNEGSEDSCTGHKAIEYTTDPMQLTFGDGVFQEISGHDDQDRVRMPDSTSIPGGAVFILIWNTQTDPANALRIQTFGGTTILTLDPDEITGMLWDNVNSGWAVV